MSLSDCPKCWATPCECGYEYKEYNNERMFEFIKSIMNYKLEKDKKEIVQMLKQEYRVWDEPSDDRSLMTRSY